MQHYGVISRQNSRFAFDVQVNQLTFFFTMRHLSFIIQHSCLRCDIGISQWDTGVLTFNIQVYHSTFKFNIQHSSFKLNFTDEWLTFWRESAESVWRSESRKRDTRDIDRSTAARVEWIQMLQTQNQRFAVKENSCLHLQMKVSNVIIFFLWTIFFSNR